MIVLSLPTKSQGGKEKNLPKTRRKKGEDTQHLIVIVIPQILNQIQLQILNRILLILIPLVMGNTGRGEISASMGRRGKLVETREREVGTVEVEDQSKSLGGLIIATFKMLTHFYLLLYSSSKL